MEKGEKEKMKKFVTFEGIDGSGKSTIMKIVYSRLKKNGYDIIKTFEPTDTWIGKQVQKSIKTDNDPYVTALTFIADRILHGKQINKWLDKDKIVLCDRYAESTYAYQGAQMQKDIENPMNFLQDLSKNRIPLPDRTYLFLIKPEKAISRIQNRDELIPFERKQFLEKVQNNYLRLAKGKRFKKIDATKNIDELVNIIYKDILEK